MIREFYDSWSAMFLLLRALSQRFSRISKHTPSKQLNSRCGSRPVSTSKLSSDPYLINVALGKPAAQSTLSGWSTELGAGGLINGDFSQNFGFHTDLEDAPWWDVDLLVRVPIEAIIVHNRLDTAQEAARTLKIEISDDKKTWITVHIGLCHFGSHLYGMPLTIPLGGKVCARFVRLSLTERAYFHLSQLEVLVDRRKLDFIAIREAYNLDVELMGERHGVDFYASYALTSADEHCRGPLIGLELVANGAFGNCTMQYSLAIILAKRLGLPYIKISEDDRSGLIRLRERLTVEDITFVPASEPLPRGGVFMRGLFWDMGPLRRAIGDISPSEVHAVIRNIVRKVFNALPDEFTTKPENELFIHIRSGDIFGNWVHPLYVQPPLSFYTTIVDKLVGSGTIAQVKLVFENRLNPVIEHLEVYLTSKRIPYSIQSGSINEDIEALVNGRYMVFGLGTFGPAICHLSEKVNMVFFFAPGIPQGFGSIPSVEKAFEVIDGVGDYIKPGEWQNTPEQRELMVNYPAANLIFPWSIGE